MHRRPATRTVPELAGRARPALLIGVLAVGVALLPWTGHLDHVLPDQHGSDHWRMVWVGFDLGLAGCLTAAAWLGWRRRRAVVPMLAVTAALLICDAWFDVLLDWDSPDRAASLALALLVELPAAAGLLALTRPVLAGGVTTWLVTPTEAELVHADPDCRRVGERVDLEGPITEQALAVVTDLPAVTVADALHRLAGAGAVRRRWDGRWVRRVQNLYWPEPDDVTWSSPGERDRYRAFLTARYDRELRIFGLAAARRSGFGEWATGSRAGAHLTAAELDRFEREYLDLVFRYGQLHARPGPATRHLALRFYVFPHEVVDEVDRELTRSEPIFRD
jgi:hypothetical protein